MPGRKTDRMTKTEQAEAHSIPQRPVYEYQIPVYGSPSDNSTSVQNDDRRDYALDRVSLQNLHF